MPDYSQGKIYKVVSPNHSKIYIGSTVKTLADRFSEHKSNRKCTSVEIIDAGDSDIKLIEDFPCLDKAQLEDREGEIQLMDWDGCVNKQVAGAVRRAGGKKEYCKQYQKANAETIKAQKKIYNKANAETIKAYNKAYNKANAETINAQKRQKYTCFCGGKYTHTHRAHHRKTKRHQDFVEIISMV